MLFIPLIYQLGQDFFAKSFNTDGSNIKQASNNQFKKLIKVGLSSLIIFFTPLALWLYTAWQKTGNIFTPFSSQGLWQKKFTWIFQTIFQPLNFVGFVSPTEKYLAIISLIVLVMGFTLSKNKKYFWYSLAMLALPLSSGTLASFARYLLVIFPLFIFLAQLSQEKKILSQAIIAFFISLQVMFFIAWCRFYWII